MAPLTGTHRGGGATTHALATTNAVGGGLPATHTNMNAPADLTTASIQRGLTTGTSKTSTRTTTTPRSTPTGSLTNNQLAYDLGEVAKCLNLPYPNSENIFAPAKFSLKAVDSQLNAFIRQYNQNSLTKLDYYDPTQGAVVNAFNTVFRASTSIELLGTFVTLEYRNNNTAPYHHFVSGYNNYGKTGVFRISTAAAKKISTALIALGIVGVIAINMSLAHTPQARQRHQRVAVKSRRLPSPLAINLLHFSWMDPPSFQFSPIFLQSSSN